MIASLGTHWSLGSLFVNIHVETPEESCNIPLNLDPHREISLFMYHETKVLKSSTWLCPCQQYTLSQVVTHSEKLHYIDCPKSQMCLCNIAFAAQSIYLILKYKYI